MARARAQQTALFAEEHWLSNRRKPVSPQARAMCTRGKKAAPAPKPWECVLLVVDTARVSGWAIGARGQVRESGQHDTEQRPDLTQGVVARAVSLAKLLSVPAVLVLEAPYGGRKHPGEIAILVALGAAKERWRGPWRAAGEAKSRIVTVQPNQWRGAVLGSAFAMRKRSEVRPAELSMARGILGREHVGADEAAAVCIHHWAAHAERVGEAIGAKAVRKSVATWRAGGAR